MARRRLRTRSSGTMATVVQLVGLCLILAFVLLFRDHISHSASAFFGAFGGSDVRVEEPSTSDWENPEASAPAAAE